MIFWELRLKFMHAMQLYVFLRFRNMITLASNFFNPNKMFLVAVILLYQKQVKIDLGYPAQCRFNP